MLSWLVLWRNRLIAYIFDFLMIPVAWFSAYWTAFDLHKIASGKLDQVMVWFLPIVLLQVAAFWTVGLYRGVWRFASVPDFIRIAKATAAGTVGVLLLFFFARPPFELPRVVPILYGFVLGSGLGGARLLFRWLKDYRHFFGNSKRVLIVGAGNAGEGLVRDLLRYDNHLYQPVAILDDNPAKLGRDIHGVRIVGKCDKIAELVHQYNIDLVFIAIPAATSAQMRRVVSLCEETKLPFRTLPSINDLATGRVDIKLLRAVSLEDLLGRDQVHLDWNSIRKDLQNKIILVSGGGGSIGSELCRQIAPLGPKRLIVIDHSEYNLYTIDMELRKNFPQLALESLLLDITDQFGVRQAFHIYQPDMVFHAAAYKHVPLLEKQGRVAIHNNVIGTEILARAAAEHKVSKFVLISTDKAVNPANLMGATK